MRNLAEYPVMEGEIIAYLETLGSELQGQDRVGDIRPVILATVVEIVKAVGDVNREAGGARCRSIAQVSSHRRCAGIQ